jgi:hypothetical protein
MSVLRREFNRFAREIGEIALREVLKDKLAESTIELPSTTLEELVRNLLRLKDDELALQSTLQDEVRAFMQGLSWSKDDGNRLAAYASALIETIPGMVQDAIERISVGTHETLRTNWPQRHDYEVEESRGFAARIEQRWGKGLASLRMLATCCREFGGEQTRPLRASRKHRLRYGVLLRLHARACQVADEIIVLLENGLADGAMARWRTMYELAVVARVISNGDELLAGRYLDHQVVEAKREAEAFDEAQKSAGLPTLNPRLRRRIMRDYDRAREKYGKSFGQDAGWAAELIAPNARSLTSLQRLVGDIGAIPEYKLANHNVHAGPHSLFNRLGQIGRRKMLLAGRSNAGLLRPAENMAFTLVSITGTLVQDWSDPDDLVQIATLYKIRDTVPKAFARAEYRLRQAEAKYERIARKNSRDRRAARMKASLPPTPSSTPPPPARP